MDKTSKNTDDKARARNSVSTQYEVGNKQREADACINI